MNHLDGKDGSQSEALVGLQTLRVVMMMMMMMMMMMTTTILGNGDDDDDEIRSIFMCFPVH
jgi:hypothetical protein